MGFINGGGYAILKYHHKPEYVGKFVAVGLHDSDTDLTEIFILPENKRTIVDIGCLELITDKEQERSVKLLYDKKI